MERTLERDPSRKETIRHGTARGPYLPVCVRLWILRFSERANTFPQAGNGHGNGFSPVCTRMWFTSLYFALKGRPLRVQPSQKQAWVVHSGPPTWSTVRCVTISCIELKILLHVLRLPPSPAPPPPPPPRPAASAPQPEMVVRVMRMVRMVGRQLRFHPQALHLLLDGRRVAHIPEEGPGRARVDGKVGERVMLVVVVHGRRVLALVVCVVSVVRVRSPAEASPAAAIARIECAPA
uniref:Uncharacterized protein n=1 Tax=Anopheles atroparvus TaxID=41427 RepID=A0A182IQ98_ANOAO